MLTFFLFSGNELIQGFECAILVLFTTELQGSHSDTILSRCKSRMIIVSSEKAVKEMTLSGEFSNNWAIKDIVIGAVFIYSYSAI